MTSLIAGLTCRGHGLLLLLHWRCCCCCSIVKLHQHSVWTSSTAANRGELLHVKPEATCRPFPSFSCRLGGGHSAFSWPRQGITSTTQSNKSTVVVVGGLAQTLA